MVLQFIINDPENTTRCSIDPIVGHYYHVYRLTHVSDSQQYYSTELPVFYGRVIEIPPHLDERGFTFCTVAFFAPDEEDSPPPFICLIPRQGKWVSLNDNWYGVVEDTDALFGDIKNAAKTN